jgi:3D (Asp-Asp-Asp) domain-containing protein
MLKLCLLLLTPLCSDSLASNTKNTDSMNTSAVIRNLHLHDVKTTAYTHTESDHIVYGAKAARGENLKYGKVRSAAADWSVYPVGTVFQIEGEKTLYEVDDYGSALVGTETIDLYRPSKASMNEWGARHVNINVIKWGSLETSLAILKPREHKAPHIHQMISAIERLSPGAS